MEANGEIIDYAVVLQGPGTVNKTYTTETHLMLSELTSFTPYNLSIAAVTRIGAGPSVIIPLHTDEAGQRCIFIVFLEELICSKCKYLIRIWMWRLFDIWIFQTKIWKLFCLIFENVNFC